jgi:hypothetical protein
MEMIVGETVTGGPEKNNTQGRPYKDHTHQEVLWK